MSRKSHLMVYARLVMCAWFLFGVSVARASAQDYVNSITFQNHSGEDAVVKVVGPVRWAVPVPNATDRTIHVPAGNYYIVTRYCNQLGNCTYTKGDPFTVVQTETQYSQILITLHKVPNGNYRTEPTNEAEFDGN